MGEGWATAAFVAELIELQSDKDAEEFIVSSDHPLDIDMDICGDVKAR